MTKLKKGDFVEVRFDIHPQITAKFIGKITSVKNGKYTIVDHKNRKLGTFDKSQIETR